MPKPPSPSTQLKAAELRRCVGFNLRQATRVVTQLYDGILRPSGLRSTQFSLLSVIGIREHVSITQLAEDAVMDRTTLTRNLDLLKREGLVRIQPRDDGRVRDVTLTPAARHKLAVATPLWEKAQTHITKQLGAGRVERLLADLTTVVVGTQKT